MRSVLSAPSIAVIAESMLAVGLEAGAADRRQAEAARVVGHARDRLRARAGLVEHHLEVVAVEQVDAVVGGIAREGVDLRQQRVVVRLQAGARRTRGRNRGRTVERAVADVQSAGHAGRRTSHGQAVRRGGRRHHDGQRATGARDRRGHAGEAGQRGVQLRQPGDLADAVAERDRLVRAAVDRNRQGSAGAAERCRAGWSR